MSTTPSTAHTRVLPFKGTSNFRDLGGYLTTEGWSVKWGVLYRAGHLAKLRNGDLRLFETLDIHTLVDLRSRIERERDPDRLPAEHHIHVFALPVLDKGNEMIHEVSRRMRDNDFDGYDPDLKMAEAYRQFVTEFSEPYRQFVHAVLAAGGAPVLWHCTAGKDRAGFAAALILRLLGVPHAIVVQDYLLSACYLRPRPGLLWLLRLTRGPRAVRIVKTLVQVKERWLQGAFDAIDERWGSLDAYAKQALQLSPASISRLRQTLLDPPAS
jgi:protein-tyrosine phosphatase